MTVKRFISLILIAVCLLSSCQGGTKIAPQITTGSPKILSNVDFTNHLTVSIGFWDIQNMVSNTQNDAILDYIEKSFNITIEPVSVNWADYKERYQILCATRSLPDMFANVTISSSDNNDSASLENLILSNYIRSLPKDMEPYPNLRQLLAKCGNIKSSDGKYYIIPRLSFQDEALCSSDAAMIVRKDWMKKLNITTPKSISEFTDMVCAFAKKDPDGNHKDDTIGYNCNNRAALGKWLMLGIAPECNVFTWIKTKDGYLPSYLTPDFDDVIVAYRTLYQRGGLDPDFYIKKTTDAVNDFISGKLGALEYKSSPASLMDLKSQWELYQTLPFEDCVDVLPIFPAKDGNSYSNSSMIFWSETLFSSAVDDEKMERLLYLYEYLLSEEGLDLVKYGLQGVDYEKENNNYRCLLNTKETGLTTLLQQKYPSLMLFANIASWGGTWDDFDNNELNTLRYGKYPLKLARKDLMWNIKNTKQVERPFDFFLMPKDTTEYFNTETVKDDFTRVIIGKEDPIAMWKEIVDGYYKNGLADYIKQQNDKFKQYSK